MVILDRGTIMNSKFWKTLTVKLGIRWKPSTAYHPQTDGQMERLNQTLEQYLRCYVNFEQNNWVTLLSMAQFAYNSHKNETTRLSPFYANYGFEPEAYREALPTERWAQASKISVDKLKSIVMKLQPSGVPKCWQVTTEASPRCHRLATRLQPGCHRGAALPEASNMPG